MAETQGRVGRVKRLRCKRGDPEVRKAEDRLFADQRELDAARGAAEEAGSRTSGQCLRQVEEERDRAQKVLLELRRRGRRGGS